MTTIMLWQFATPNLTDGIAAALAYYARKYGQPVERVEVHASLTPPKEQHPPVINSPLVPSSRNCHIVPRPPSPATDTEQLSFSGDVSEWDVNLSSNI